MNNVITSQRRAAGAVPTTTSSQRPRILIADDSTVAREGVLAIIRRDSRYVVCGFAPNQQTMYELLETQKPDLLLIEPFLGNHDGIFLLKEIAARFTNIRILVISKHEEEIYAERALRAGASGYCMKTAKCDELVHAIETIVAGELYFSPAVALLAVRKLTQRPAAHPNSGNLTDRELHVFVLSGAGYGTNRIAKELGISPRTVETYYEHIKLKLGYTDAHALHRGARELSALSHHK
jgi:DNA-binding NarL/FixJ family response regulator